jgi:ferredoxin
MRVIVDLNRCQGYAQCVFLAPDVFELHGEEALRYDPNPDDAQRLRVMRAAAACPTQAILLDRLDETEAGGAAWRGRFTRLTHRRDRHSPRCTPEVLSSWYIEVLVQSI